MKLGIDIGSTTIKYVLVDDKNNIIFKNYERHFSQIDELLIKALELSKEYTSEDISVALSGSAAMGLATNHDIEFTQEVYATKVAIKEKLSETDVVIELGGEDAKVLFLTNGLEVRMNGSCAGGTGAFIDQMAALLDCTPNDINEFAKNAKKIYPIASRCGVFAKSDIQPLLNQGATKEDVSKSIFSAVVNQTVGGLAQGRMIEGNVVYLGGPLSFISELRNCFDEYLNLKGVCPEDSLYFVALGTAISSTKKINIDELIYKIKHNKKTGHYETTKPLFESEEEYDTFVKRHDKASVKISDSNGEEGVYIGIDSGSTTVKLVVMTKNEEILYTRYAPSQGNPVEIIRNFLIDFYESYPLAVVLGSASTGYGEDLIKKAFNLDFGLVETVAHYTAAKKFNPNVDFIIDIGGQDIKCFKIKDGVIDDIYLNEACSSGCGSFLQSFATVLGYSMEDFAKLGLLASSPVELGSRCTVFMNSSVKQAQKDGASVENIAAGLSISVVKNAIYKVIRATSVVELGENIVVQGGTFLNDSVLRAFEQVLNAEVLRPNISGNMGAYGACLFAKEKNSEVSKTLKLQELYDFEITVNHTNCGICSNRCSLTINSFNDSRKYIGGNKCEKPIKKTPIDENLNLYIYKRDLLKEYMDNGVVENSKGKIGLPLVLNMFELYPFWHKFFTTLGYSVYSSDFSNSTTYVDGQTSIPSDTVCYPAKLVHGHIEKLVKAELDAIFYPCMSYNFNDGRSQNHYNCPVVAYYPELIDANVSSTKNTKFIYDYIGIHRRKDFEVKIKEILAKYGFIEDKTLIKKAVEAAYNERDVFLNKIKIKGQIIINEARKQNKKIICLAGRPYHVDPEINHGIDKLISSLDLALVTEDSVAHLVDTTKVSVLNQWTYHSRLYDAASFINKNDDIELVQLVSFGCGLDAITTDTVREILKRNNKIYTQLKIDEITNLGAVKIRLRSLLSTIS